MNKTKRVARLLEQFRVGSTSIVHPAPYVDAGDDDEDELTDEDLEDVEDLEDEKAKKKGQKGAPPPGLDPTIEQILSGNVIWYDPETLMHDAKVGLGKDPKMSSSADRADEAFDDYCTRSAGIAQEMAQRLNRDPRELSNSWANLAANGLSPSVRLNGMFTLLGFVYTMPHHRALFARLVEEVDADLKFYDAISKSARAARASVERHRRAGMPPAGARSKPVKRENARSATPARGDRAWRSFDELDASRQRPTYDIDGTLIVNGERVDGTGRGPLRRSAR